MPKATTNSTFVVFHLADVAKSETPNIASSLNLNIIIDDFSTEIKTTWYYSTSIQHFGANQRSHSDLLVNKEWFFIALKILLLTVLYKNSLAAAGRRPNFCSTLFGTLYLADGFFINRVKLSLLLCCHRHLLERCCISQQVCPFWFSRNV